MKNVKHVLIATPVLLVGGTELQMLSLVRVLAGANYKISICCYYEYDRIQASAFEAAGAEVLLLNCNRADGLLYLLGRLFTLFKETRPHIIHVQYLAPGFIPIIAARLAGIKTIFSTIHIAGCSTYRVKAKMLVRTAAALCTAFICVSEGVEHFWFGNSTLQDSNSNFLFKKHFTIYNSIDIDYIWTAVCSVDRDELRTELNISNKKVIGIVGRLAQQKGHTVMLDAMHDIIKSIPDCVLLIIGEGPEREQLHQKAQQLGIHNHIIWLGMVLPDKVFQYYAIIDVLAVPSLYEGFGLVAAEAMAAKLPVVATRVAGLNEIIDHGVTGYLVNVGDAKDLSARTKELLMNPERSRIFGHNGYMRANKYFSMTRFNNDMIKTYSILCQQ
jgi:L-malate glycosyltransferase